MSGHKSWDAFITERLETDPGFRATYERAKHELDAAWEVECRYGNCVIFVSPDSSVGPDQEDGWGPVGCPCSGEEVFDGTTSA